MPHPAWNHERVAVRQRHSTLSVILVERYIDFTFDEDQQLVTVGVHLAAVRRALRHTSLASEATGDSRMCSSLLHDRFDAPLGRELHGVFRKVDCCRTGHQELPSSP
jgi:hypothetical protein